MNLNCFYAYPNKTNRITKFIQIGGYIYSIDDIHKLDSWSYKQLELRMLIETEKELEP